MSNLWYRHSNVRSSEPVIDTIVNGTFPWTATVAEIDPMAISLLFERAALAGSSEEIDGYASISDGLHDCRATRVLGWLLNGVSP